ncbi:MAG: tRNA threonylcarbamoyladenosine dehydratase [Clostridiales bacterium]|nr:tRNA threonylcarbamoyladenosine dehydratase [Clostridiales bacterium]
MEDQFERLELLLGEKAIDRLKASTVAVFGIGGVGGYVTEALARSGVGSFILVDNDVVSITNLNRQIIALHSTVGKSKVKVMAERIRDINPDAKVTVKQCFFLPETADEFDFSSYDYVADCVDTVAAKTEIISRAKEAGVPVISSMGAGGKLHPEMFEVADISKTTVCPLAKVMRRELKKRGINNVKVVFSKEEPIKNLVGGQADPETGRHVPGSSAFTPSVAGLIMASEIVKDLSGKNE